VVLGKKLIENGFLGFETLLTQLSSDQIWAVLFLKDQRQMISYFPHKKGKN